MFRKKTDKFFLSHYLLRHGKHSNTLYLPCQYLVNTNVILYQAIHFLIYPVAFAIILVESMGIWLMDEQKKRDFRLPIEWVDRIFQRLHEKWGDHYLKLFLHPEDLEFERTRWQSGLFGVTADEIRHVLIMCNNDLIHSPPNVIEFYHYCKGYKIPIRQKPVSYLSPPTKEIAEKYLKLIRDKLHGKLNSEGYATLSALDQQILHKQNGKVSSHWQDD